jgi:hypothetical protein
MHLLVDISPHGYGHIAQCAPVVNALGERLPRLRVTVRSAAPRPVLASHFQGELQVLAPGPEPGLVMADAMTVLPRASYDTYRAFHARWDAEVAEAARALKTLRVDLVLSAVSCLPLAAARRAGVPAVGIGSFHWATMFQSYCGTFEGAGEIAARMLAAYRDATHFIALTPGMPMPELEPILVGPVARLGRSRSAEIRARLHLEGTTRLALVALGGIPALLPLDSLPRIPGLHWLTPEDAAPEREDATPFDRLDLPFGDLIASADLVLTKPGYGTFVEAACAGAAVVTLARPDWPETPHLVEWLRSHARCEVLPPEDLASREFQTTVERLLALPRPAAVRPTGIQEAAKVLQELLPIRRDE